MILANMEEKSTHHGPFTKKGRYRARRRRRLFIQQLALCYLCGDPMTLERGRLNSATFDHDPPRAVSKGSHGGARNLACHRCNHLRMTLTPDEARIVIRLRKEEGRWRDIE